MTNILDDGDGDAKRIQAAFLKGHVKMLRLGMKNSRYSGMDILSKVAKLTGKGYKRGQYDLALKHLEEILNG